MTPDQIRADRRDWDSIAAEADLDAAEVERIKRGDAPPTPSSYILGDALAVMRQLPPGGKAVQGVVTSPPYNLGLKPRSGQGTNWRGNRLANEGYAGHEDSMPRDEYVEWQRSIIAAGLALVGDAGVVLWQHKPVHRGKAVLEHHDILEGFPLRQRIIWDRGSTNNHDATLVPPSYEFVAVLAGPNWRLADIAYKESRTWGAVWRIPPEANDHEAPFPMELAQRMVLMVDGAVLDPFAGSGTVGLAALTQGKDYYLVDCAERNRDMFEERLKHGGRARFKQAGGATQECLGIDWSGG